MTDTRVLSNQRVTVWIGADTAIVDYTAPKASEIAAMLNVSEAIRWNGFDLNIQASSTDTDVSLTDAAGAKSRSYTNFGGHIAFFAPKVGDTSSLLYTTRQLVKVPRTRLAVVVRTITLNSVGAAAADEVNAYHVITDSNSYDRGKVSYAYAINFKSLNDIGVNAILAPAAPVAVVTTPAATLAITTGTVKYITVKYQGSNVTKGATYVSSNPLIATVDKNGVVVGVLAGTCNITVTYPGSAAGTPIAVTVS